MRYFTFRKHGSFFAESVILSSTFNETILKDKINPNEMIGSGTTFFDNNNFHCDELKNKFQLKVHDKDEDTIKSDMLHGMKFICLQRTSIEDFHEYILFSYHFELDESIECLKEFNVISSGEINYSAGKIIGSRKIDEKDLNNIKKLLQKK